MKTNPLQKFIESMQQIWGPLDSSLITKSQLLFEELLRDPNFDIKDLQGKHKLYQDLKHGFMLLAHTEEQDLYRPPHDHGDGWVIYGVKSGEIEMGSYKRLRDVNSEPRLVRRNKEQLKQGDSRVYLPGDIHDTKCLSESVLMLRFTSCDLSKEKQQGRMRIFTKPSE